MMARTPLPFGIKPLHFQTIKLGDEIGDNSDVAMAFSNHVAQAFIETGIKLADDETFACMLCVVKKPQYASDVTGIAPEFMIDYPEPEPIVEGSTFAPSVQDPTPEPSLKDMGALRMAYAESTQEDFPFTKLHAKAWRSIRYSVVMKPVIMAKVTEKRANDRIPY
jgi:hypothetical protein